MVKKIFSISDSKTCYLSPFVEDTVEAAKRGFEFACQNSNSLMAFSPNDFSLFEIGSFDSDNGNITALYPFNLICNGGEFF